MKDSGTPASVRVSAASKVLEYALKSVELEVLEARLTEVEQGQALFSELFVEVKG